MLRSPLNLPRGSERDAIEKNSFHIAAYHEKTIIGVGRLQIEPNHSARIRYMAVDDNYQNQGVGSSILIRLEGFAQTNNLRICWLYAREKAIKFYSKNGYAVKGESKSELSELKHKRMEKSLN